MTVIAPVFWKVEEEKNVWPTYLLNQMLDKRNRHTREGRNSEDENTGKFWQAHRWNSPWEKWEHKIKKNIFLNNSYFTTFKTKNNNKVNPWHRQSPLFRALRWN